MPHFALQNAVLNNIGASCHRCLYPQASDQDILVPVFTGDENRRFAHFWLKVYCRWAVQEGLSDDQTLLVAIEHLFNSAYGWGGQFLKGSTWQGFVQAFCEKFITEDRVAISKVLGWYLNLKERATVDTIRFSYRELQTATNYFSAKNELGKGGFGTVYKGHLAGNKVVAVKKLKQVNKSGLLQVHNEVDILSKVRHPNLVKLLGCCLEPKDPLLVYEYVPNGNLMEQLHGLFGKGLNWETRLKIAFETADAVTHLHHCGSSPVYHRDIKSTNILLDSQLRAKVADFGLSKFLVSDVTHITTLPMGTPGYIDPCYLQTYHLTEKSDVYSFGVVLLELISGLCALDLDRPKAEITLAALVLAKISSGKVQDIIDPRLKEEGEGCINMAIEVASLASKCLSLDLKCRPMMREVADELQSIQETWVII